MQPAPTFYHRLRQPIPSSLERCCQAMSSSATGLCRTGLDYVVSRSEKRGREPIADSNGPISALDPFFPVGNPTLFSSRSQSSGDDVRVRDLTVQRVRLLPGDLVHVLRLRTGEFVDPAQVGPRVGVASSMSCKSKLE